ncbi:TVP38/TMEM64 family protein [Deltaproteobacteria bacterium IMCC39524]|nr:TVP38/TMEM64 family protein [Deltaproteobacteria bacterium IMCC39524]
MKNSALKLIFGGLWLSLFLFALFFWWQSGIALTSVPSLLQEWLDNVGLLNAAFIYIVLYAIRPLILFPATILTIASGLIFGPWLGTLFTIIGENASANFGFSLVRWFGREIVATHSTPLMSRWNEKLKQNGVISVMTMRLIMLPFDAVNFSCGLTAIRQRDYAIGTFIGILPSLIGFVLLGGIAASGAHNRTLVVVLSALFMLLGFGIAHYLKRRDSAEIPSE